MTQSTDTPWNSFPLDTGTGRGVGGVHFSLPHNIGTKGVAADYQESV